MERWTREEVKDLKRGYKNTLTSSLAYDFNRSDRSVFLKAQSLGLRKTRKYMKDLRAGM